MFAERNVRGTADARPSATVILPIIDRAATLRVALDQVQHQTLQDFELIIACQRASGEVLEVVEQFEREDPRVRSIRTNAEGMRTAQARHLALEDSKSENIFILQDDDIWLPDHLKTLVPLLQDHDMAINLVTAASLSGALHSWLVTYEHPSVRQQYIDERFPRCLFEGHFGFRRSTYFGLDVRWDKVESGGLKHHLLREFLRNAPPVRLGYTQEITSISLNSPPRRHLTNQQRAREMQGLIDAHGLKSGAQLKPTTAAVGFFAHHLGRILNRGCRDLDDALARLGISLKPDVRQDGLQFWRLDESQRADLKSFWAAIQGRAKDPEELGRLLVAVSEPLTSFAIRPGHLSLFARLYGEPLVAEACRSVMSDDRLMLEKRAVAAVLAAFAAFGDGRSDEARQYLERARQWSPLIADQAILLKAKVALSRQDSVQLLKLLSRALESELATRQEVFGLLRDFVNMEGP